MTRVRTTDRQLTCTRVTCTSVTWRDVRDTHTGHCCVHGEETLGDDVTQVFVCAVFVERVSVRLYTSDVKLAFNLGHIGLKLNKSGTY